MFQLGLNLISLVWSFEAKIEQTRLILLRHLRINQINVTNSHQTKKVVSIYILHTVV